MVGLRTYQHPCPFWLQAIQCSEDTPQQPDPVGGGHIVPLRQQTVEYYTAGGELWVIARCGSYHTMSCETTRDDVQASATQVHELPPRGELSSQTHSLFFWGIVDVHSFSSLSYDGPKTLPKRALHLVWSKASSFKWEYPVLSLRSSSSFLRLLPGLLVTSISPFTLPSITCFWSTAL